MDIKLLAKIGLRLDDWYGDGYRLERIRNPNHGRIAAMRMVDGEPEFWDEAAILKEYRNTVAKFIAKERKRKRPMATGPNRFLTDDEFAEMLTWKL